MAESCLPNGRRCSNVRDDFPESHVQTQHGNFAENKKLSALPLQLLYVLHESTIIPKLSY